MNARANRVRSVSLSLSILFPLGPPLFFLHIHFDPFHYSHTNSVCIHCSYHFIYNHFSHFVVETILHFLLLKACAGFYFLFFSTPQLRESGSIRIRSVAHVPEEKSEREQVEETEKAKKKKTYAFFSHLGVHWHTSADLHPHTHSYTHTPRSQCVLDLIHPMWN